MNQSWDANEYNKHASFVSQHGSNVLALLNPRSGENILDLGCGDGTLSLEIRNAGAGVFGVDASANMIEKAQSRGVPAKVMLGESLSFDNEFDAVFSNAALHWMLNADAVILGVFQALKPGGRFVGEFGGKDNIDALVQAMETVFASNADFPQFNNPWYFPDVQEYKAKLESTGFKVDYIELIARPTPLETGIKEWLKIFSHGITSSLTDSQKARFLSGVEDLVKPDLLINHQWIADYVRLRFHATKI
ncbi:class I SAM-dependent methyltransferase [Thalassotalea litorea]|uniref:class I SAM-dependent methyltransferase n=1 Tax=Thalassotalea litorea TaxID=2020715 RepID=UPI0037366596